VLTGDDAAIAAIEDAFVAHWSIFGRWDHGSLHDEDGVQWFETAIPHLPYNMVMRTRIDDPSPEGVIARIAGRFRDREVPYIWAVHHFDRPDGLALLLARQGLDLVETVTGMDMDLETWEPGVNVTDAEIVRADHDETTLREYIELIRTYWSVPDSAQKMLEAFNYTYARDEAPGVRLVARLNDHPIGKLFMNTSELSLGRVAIYGVSVQPEARGHGVATGLMTEALVRAKALGAARCVLHSSEMAVSLYRRMGYVERCHISAYATAPLFGTHHH